MHGACVCFQPALTRHKHDLCTSIRYGECCIAFALSVYTGLHYSMQGCVCILICSFTNYQPFRITHSAKHIHHGNTLELHSYVFIIIWYSCPTKLETFFQCDIIQPTAGNK